MKKILIIGPLGDYGGREVEVNLIAKSLQSLYHVNILSTTYFTTNSFVFNDLQNTSFKSLDLILYKKIKFKIPTLLSYIKNKKKYEPYFYTNNNISKLLGYKKEKQKALINVLVKYDLVILPVQLSTEFLEPIINECNNLNIPVIIRTIATIKDIPLFIKNNTYSKLFYIHHSINNSQRLINVKNHNYFLIDQTALNEKKLINLNNKLSNKDLTFGYIGRLSPEKQIIELANFFSNSTHKFVVAGDGPLKNQLENIIQNKDNCCYLGLIENKNIHSFLDKIDVLIISSTEETGPLVGIEAMAAAKIIISTKVGAMTERLQNTNNNFWISIDNFEYELENVINKILSLDSTELINIGKYNRQTYLDKYSNKSIENQYIKTIKKILPCV